MEPARKPDGTEGRAAVSAEIRALMGRHRVTQTALADYLKMSQSALSERLNSFVPWNVDDLYKIAARFGVAVESLTPPIIHDMLTSSPYLRECSYRGQMSLFGEAVSARSLP